MNPLRTHVMHDLECPVCVQPIARMEVYPAGVRMVHISDSEMRVWHCDVRFRESR